MGNYNLFWDIRTFDTSLYNPRKMDDFQRVENLNNCKIFVHKTQIKCYRLQIIHIILIIFLFIQGDVHN